MCIRDRFITALFIGCDTEPVGVQVTFDDEKSNALKEAYVKYLDQTFDGDIWSEDLQFYGNSTEPIGYDEAISLIGAHHELYDDISMSWGDGEEVSEIAFIQTINYPEYGYVSQAWFTWKGTGKFSGETVEIPCHIGYLWGEDGKIINEWQHSDQTHFNAEVALSLAVAE